MNGLGYGDYIIRNVHQLLIADNWYYFMLITEDLGTDEAYVGKYDYIFTGCFIYAYNNINAIKTVLTNYATAGKSEAILAIYAVPEFAFSTENIQGGYLMDNSNGSSVNEVYQTNQDNINGYYPKNNKLFVAPYNVLELTNNSGNTSVLNPALFDTFNDYKFNIISSIVGNVKSICYPKNYATQEEFNILQRKFSTENGVTLNDYPHCAYVSDTFKNWLALNGTSNNINLGLGALGGVLFAGLGAYMGNPLMVASGVTSMSNSVGQYIGAMDKADVTPNQSRGNINNANPLIAQNVYGFYINHKTIKAEYAKIIDDYFTMFGYKVNRMEVPNLRSRQNWNYIETKNINLTGNIPNEHLNKIKSIFDNGVTLWHNDNVGNYNRENNNR